MRSKILEKLHYLNRRDLFRRGITAALPGSRGFPAPVTTGTLNIGPDITSRLASRRSSTVRAPSPSSAAR